MNTPTFQPLIDVTASPMGSADCARFIQEAATQVAALLTPLRCAGAAYTIGIRLDTDAEVQALNAQFRQKDKPTNVLSFPTDDADAWDEDDEVMYLGDIIIADGVLAREAAEKGLPVAQHLQHLVVHGILHIYGYDHIVDTEAEMMENTEIRILNNLGIENPYE